MSISTQRILPVALLAALLAAVALVTPLAAQNSSFDPANPAPTMGTEGEIKIFHLGPYTIPAGRVVNGRTLPGELNQFLNVPAMGDGFMTGFDSRIIDSARVPVNAVELYLHHAVFINRRATDLTCSFIGGERFAAAGAERIPFALPQGYGYRLRSTDTYLCNLHMQNFTLQAQTVYYQYSMTIEAASMPLIEVRPWWTDIVNCNSSYNVPPGTGTDVRQTDYTVGTRMTILTAGPHLHCGGTRLQFLNKSAGNTTIFDWSNTNCPVQMSTSRPNPPLVLNPGTVVTIKATYQQHPTDELDAMGIVLAYVVLG
ncbi:MAG: hypothetical protein IPM13_17665 [Phycisphaerales bacterium]|nr:hypothetical protein [Phycisphaerales bacterium]